MVRERDLWIGIALLVAVFVLYLRTISPTVLDGDSGEYQYMAYILGVPHSTGYPLYILLGKLFTFLPFGDVAFRINLFSATFAALAAPFVFWTCRLLVPRRLPAVLATAAFAVSPSVWGSGVEAEAYALHLFLGVLCVFLAIRWHRKGKRRDLLLLALTYGFGLTNHVFVRFIAPALVLLLWFNRTRLNRQLLGQAAVLAALPLLLYAYIPIRANALIAQQDPANRELYGREDAILKGTVTAYYVNSLAGFVNLVSGFDNIQKLDVKSPLQETSRIEHSSALLIQQFGLAGVALAVAGAIVEFRRERKVFAFLFTAGAGVGIIAFYLRGMSTVFYFSLTYLVLALWIGSGMDSLIEWARRVREAAARPEVRFVASSPVVALVLAMLPVSSLFANYPRLDASNNYGPREYAEAVLRDDLAPNAVVVAPWEVSQPIRYLQFVENQRPDLLVVSASPSSKQFETMLANAQRLNRPFYLVLFNPELRAATGPRFVNVIPLIRPTRVEPHYALSNMNIVDQVQVLGFDVQPDPPQPGKPVRILVYYRTVARMYPMYSAALSVSDLVARPWGDYYGIPGSEYYPTYLWQEGNLYRDEWQFIWPPNAPSGLYNLDLSWFVYDLDTRKSDPDSERHISLGAIRAGDFSVGPITNPLNASVGNGFKLLGWNATPSVAGGVVSLAPGASLDLDLFWQAEKGVSQSYTVFVHLARPDGQVRADADSVPFQGLFPTSRWQVGETVRDRHTLTIPKSVSPGDYVVEVGMYLASTGERLPILTKGEPMDKAILFRVQVR